MALTEKERQQIDAYLTDEDKEEIKDIVGKMQAVYTYIEKEGLYQPSMHDSERFMGFNFFLTRSLVKHSIRLSKLTWGLLILTAVLLFVTIALMIKS